MNNLNSTHPQLLGLVECDFDDGVVPVRVLLARVRERSDGERTKSILVHIRVA